MRKSKPYTPETLLEYLHRTVAVDPRMSLEDKYQLIHGRNGLPPYEETRVFTPCPSCGHDISSCREGHQCPQY